MPGMLKMTRLSDGQVFMGLSCREYAVTTDGEMVFPPHPDDEFTIETLREKKRLKQSGYAWACWDTQDGKLVHRDDSWGDEGGRFVKVEALDPREWRTEMAGWS